jgi:flagellar motor protein MotB
MKIALVTFVVLFILSATLAVIFYIQAEEYQGAESSAKAELAKFATPSEQSGISRIVGKQQSGKSYLGTMNDLLNQLVRTITGSEPDEGMPATVKVNSIARRVTEIQESMGQDLNPAYGPNGIALLETIRQLKNSLDVTRQEMETLREQFRQIQSNFTLATEQALIQQEKLRQEAVLYQQNADQVQAQYDQLKKMMELSCDEQVQTLKNRLEEEQAKVRQQQLTLLETQDKLAQTETALKTAMEKIEGIKPRPDITPTAFKPDARIIRVDLQNGILYLNVGMEDHVYRGLTFAIYDSRSPIPEDGKGKAEVEVFQVSQNVSAARIIRSTVKNPIVQEDIVANLIWDPKTSNRFVVAGDFDLDGDGTIDADGVERIKEMILRWGGTIDDEINVNTDFIVIGESPRRLNQPTPTELDLNPAAQQRYEESKQKIAVYEALAKKAELLSIPMFNQKQFYYLLGYETLASKN